MKQQYVEEVRAFSRFYSVFFGILNKRFLNSTFSLLETRIMHCACQRPGIAPSEIIAELNIDKGLLSRTLGTLARRKVIRKTKSKEDGRSVQIYITNQGEKQLEKLTKASNREVATLLANLTDAQCELLVKRMKEIKSLLGH